MTPKEKAQELIKSFMDLETSIDEVINDILLGSISIKYKEHHCKKCALIAVEEILNVAPEKGQGFDFIEIYWQEVKKEIENALEI